ncbi:MAG: hypothetical protein CR971_00950 [candidate division SR1 bacterium]|nr:MAG: hypothetical protein CR971_00950 [candidate division SR1 bacterium]
MPNLEQCKQSLQQQIIKNPKLKKNTSKLMKQSWGEDKISCIKKFGSITAVSKYSKNITTNTTTLNTNKNTNSNTTSQKNIKNNTKQYTQSTEAPHNAAPKKPYSNTTNQLIHIGNVILYIIIGIIAFAISIEIIKKIFRRGYAFLNHKRMVYLKVTLPRGDGKGDREESKEIAKDMKETIGRMEQVYMNMHKLGTLSVSDKIQQILFRKPRIVLIYNYEEGRINFIIGTYPEYRKIVEAAIGSQYEKSSVELVKKPELFTKKHFDVMPLETQEEDCYTLKSFRRMGDDPINNLIDGLRNISKYDNANIIMTIKPLGESWNDRAKKKIDLLYKNLPLTTFHFTDIFLAPWKIFAFLFNIGGGKKKKNPDEVGIVRMVKSKEESINDMGKEAGNPAFRAGLIITTSSDVKERLRDNIEGLVSAYNVYTDEYGNELNQLAIESNLFGAFFKPFWIIAAKYFLTSLLYKANVFTTGELTGLFHLPDGKYNRSDAINWMSYKVLPAPSNLPMFPEDEFGGYIMSGIVAEKYKKGNLSEILKDYPKHRAVGKKTDKVEKLIPLKDFNGDVTTTEIIEKDGEKFAKTFEEKDIYGYKIFKNAVLLGTNIYRNNYAPVYMKREDRTRHHYCVGKSGTGKSVYLQTLARQDIWNGDGCCVIDPHGDLVEDILEYIPKERAKDVIFFDAGNEERPMGLNLFEINDLDEADRTVNDATEIFIKMFGAEIFGPRIQEYFKYGSLTLLEDFEDRPTILDVTRLYTDEAYREFKVAKVTNPVVKNFWTKTYNAMGDREKAEIIPYFSSKFVSFNTNRLIRNIIGQTKSAFDITDAMNNQKILLINLSKGKIGELNAQLLGMILVSKIYNAAMARAKMDQKDRKDFYLYVDEFQNFVSNTFADILSEARKYRLSLIMAHQYIAQLEKGAGNNLGESGKSPVKDAVFGNVGTMQSFKVGAPDAEFLEKEYKPVLSAADIAGIANYKAYIKLNIDNTTSRVFSMNSIYTSDYKSKKIAGILKEYSAKKYGRKREFVDAEITARFGMDVDENELPEEVQTDELSSQKTKTQEPPESNENTVLDPGVNPENTTENTQ